MVSLRWFASILVFALLGSLVPLVPASAQVTVSSSSAVHQKRVCNQPGKNAASCYMRVRTNAQNYATAGVLPAGYGPAQLHAAYGTPTTAADPPTVAVVTAYDHPRIKSDLDVYNATFGLPAFPSCTSTVTTGCFFKVNQRGTTTGFPRTHAGWALETALDVETLHQTCQNCKLILVEATTSSYTNLMTAVDTAVRLGATIVSGSWGSTEFASQTKYDARFNKPGVAFVFAAGDSGYGVSYPASSPYVTAVGGTTLRLNADGTRASETVWANTGSGCSRYEPKPAWQTDTLCSNRTTTDVAALGDPATGAAIYSSVRYGGVKGWFKVGGTSLAAPLIAGIYALNGKVPADAVGGSLPYAQGNASNLYDITTGSNGSYASAYLCTGLLGYDGPTGLGVPSGITAFGRP